LPFRPRDKAFVDGAVDGGGAAGDVQLAVSAVEMVGDRPGTDTQLARATVRAGSVRVAVTDEGGPWRREREADGQNGRGLLIVGELASRWGRDEGGTGRTVWVEIDW
jgi:hypothetical protein